MADVSKEQIEQAIKGYVDPYLEKDLVAAKAVKAVDLDGGKVKVRVELGFPCDLHHAVRQGRKLPVCSQEHGGWNRDGQT